MKDEKIVIKTWKGNQNGTILLAIPNLITKEFNLEKPTHLILQKQSNGFLIKKLNLDVLK